MVRIIARVAAAAVTDVLFFAGVGIDALEDLIWNGLR